jgi:Shikimate 5-dehydrogenase
MDKYGLIGYPLSHSFSKDFFNTKFRSENTDAEYVNFEIPNIEQLRTVIKDNPSLKGLNVTIPYKEKVIPYLDDLSENVRLIGAVNVIRFDRKKNKLRLIGYNSDIIGFKQSIEPMLEGRTRALILGTGGSSKAVFYGLKQLGVESQVVSRDKDKALLTYDDLSPEVMALSKIIVNTTPVGMYPKVDECPAIPYEYLTEDHLLYDLLYNPNETLFMKKGKERSATVVNGLEMLLLQAYASWEFWNEN